MSYKSWICYFISLILSIGNLNSAPDIEAGKTSFKNNCASCHNKNMKDALTGPALGGSLQRWAAYPKEDFYSWVRNSQAMIKAGHPRATELWNQFKPTVMTAFPNLTDEEIESIMLYVDGVFTGTYGPKPVAGGAAATTDGGSKDSGYSFWLYLVFALLIILAIFMWNLITDLDYQLKRKEGVVSSKATIWQLLTSKAVITFVIFALVLFGGYTTVNNAISLGRQQNYAPQQPIKFSHEIHSGLHKIDCNYCHDGARRSKQSLIPATNTCMNCHAAIKKGSLDGTAEITKIFASIGYNPTTDKYIANYDSLSEQEIEAIYKRWIRESYVADNDVSPTSEATIQETDAQWKAIKESLTSETKPKIQGPIEWKRIHNLPDHVYFNHAQHVSIGKIACQKCHGKIETMNIVKQYAPLSMGWCINCHRQTDVKFADNKYYDSYKTYHDEIKKGERQSVKVVDIGGLDCQKCHY